jgi:hypothetical protein
LLPFVRFPRKGYRFIAVVENGDDEEARLVPPPKTAVGIDKPPEAAAQGTLPGTPEGKEAPGRFWALLLSVVANFRFSALLAFLPAKPAY